MDKEKLHKCVFEILQELGNDFSQDVPNLDEIGFMWGCIEEQDELKGNLKDFTNKLYEKVNTQN